MPHLRSNDENLANEKILKKNKKEEKIFIEDEKKPQKFQFFWGLSRSRDSILLCYEGFIIHLLV